jgi:hypothetical protein
MIIHQPEIIQDDEHTLLWTRIEVSKARGFFPEYLWYRVPNRYGEFLTTQSDAFLVPGLLAGMYFGENIEVRGYVSPKLAYHLTEYQFILSFRFPKLLQQVEINYNHLQSLTTKPKGVGAPFSGGIDSLFTLWKHLPHNQPNPDYQITHGIFIKGFDILHNAEKNYWLLFDKYSKEAGKIGLELIPLETNILGVSHQRLPGSYLSYPHIISSGLSLAGLFHRFYMPSSWDYYNLKKQSYASDPLVDALLSTDTLDIIHHGATHRRVEKVEEIADWELAQELLWVCLDHKFDNPAWNCSRCEKCMRTMIPLYALGKLEKFKTFAKPIKNNWEGLWWARKFSLRHNFITEMFPFVRQHKPDFVLWLRVASIFGYFRHYLVTKMPRLAKQWLRKYGYYINRNEAPDAYELLEITDLIRGQNDHPST